MPADNLAGTKTLFLNGIVVGEIEATGDYEQDIAIVRAFLKERGLDKRVTLLQAMFRQAVSFCSVAASLYERGLKSAPRDPLSVAPFVVNSALSIELYLKTLIQTQGVAQKTHVLSDLYAALPESMRAEVEIHAVRDAARLEVDLTQEGGVAGIVSHLDTAFLEWRYSYEKERTGPVRIQATILLMKALHEACKEAGAT